MSFDNATKTGSINTVVSNDKDNSIVTESSSLDEHVPELMDNNTSTVENNNDNGNDNGDDNGDDNGKGTTNDTVNDTENDTDNRTDTANNTGNGNENNDSSINTNTSINKLDDLSISFHNNDSKKLTEFQLQIVKKIYDKAVGALDEITNKPDINDVLLITVTVTNLANLVELIKINNGGGVKQPLSGGDKKQIVLFLGELLLEKIVPESNRENIKILYNSYAESVLEKIITFARKNKTVNIVSKIANTTDEIKQNCCIVS